MAKELKPKVKIEVLVAPSLKKKLAAKARKMNTSMSDVLRDFIQKFTK